MTHGTGTEKMRREVEVRERLSPLMQIEQRLDEGAHIWYTVLFCGSLTGREHSVLLARPS